MVNENITQNNNTIKLNVLYELLRSDGSTVINKKLKHAIGNQEAELFSELISRMFYFADRDQLDEDGYFFNTVLDLQVGTAMTKYQQSRVIKNLKKLGLINTKMQDSPPKRYFKVNDDIDLIGYYLEQGKNIMLELESERDKQKKRVEEDRKKGDGYFKSEETSPLNVKKLDTNNTKPNDTKKESTPQPEKTPAPSLNSSNENQPQTEVNQAIGHYLELFEKTTGEAAIISRGKDHKNIKEIINQYGIEKTLSLLDAYFETADQFVADRGYSLGLFRSNISSLIVRYKEIEAANKRRAAKDAADRKWMEEQRLRDEQLAKERAEWEALPEVEKIRKKIKDKKLLYEPMREHYEEKLSKGDLSAIEKLREYIDQEHDLAEQLKAAGGIEADKLIKELEADKQRLSEYYLKITADVPF